MWQNLERRFEKRTHHSPGFALLMMNAADEVYMNKTIVKVCKKHGNLTQADVTTNNRCLECAREYSRKWRKKNPEKVKTTNYNYRKMTSDYKSSGLEYKPTRTNNRYIAGRTEINCKKHGVVKGKDLITRENDYLRCRLCAYERARAWQKKNPEKVKIYKRSYYLSHISEETTKSICRQKKISLQEYRSHQERQQNKCAICNQENKIKLRQDGSSSPLCIDHCHKTGKIRGLLCHQCNTAIGLLKDNPLLLQNAIDYLKGTI